MTTNNFTENALCAMDKHCELMNSIKKLKEGEDIDFEYILTILGEIRKDHINSIYRADALEKKITNIKINLELPNFLKG